MILLKRELRHRPQVRILWEGLFDARALYLPALRHRGDSRRRIRLLGYRPPPDAPPAGRALRAVALEIPRAVAYRRGCRTAGSLGGVDAADPGRAAGPPPRRAHSLPEGRWPQCHRLAGGSRPLRGG